MPTGGDFIYLGPRRVRLFGIDGSAFQHPLDREATTQLSRVVGFDTVFAKVNELSLLRIAYEVNAASNVRVGPKQLPSLYAIFREACAVLDVPEPELYASQGNGTVNAYTYGHERSYVVISTNLIDLLTDDEILAVIGHELGHIKCGHVHYTMMVQLFKWLAETAGTLTLGIGNLISVPMQQALFAWQRRAELSCDRAALLTAQQPRPCVTSLLKLAAGTSRLADQLDPDAFMRQARAYTDDLSRSDTDKMYRLIASFYQQTHPFAVERAKELGDWIDGPEYPRIMAGVYPRTPRRT